MNRDGIQGKIPKPTSNETLFKSLISKQIQDLLPLEKKKLLDIDINVWLTRLLNPEIELRKAGKTVRFCCLLFSLD